MDSNAVSPGDFRQLQSKASSFPCQSFAFYDFEDLRLPQVLWNDDSLILLATAENGARHLLWAAIQPQRLLRAIGNLEGGLSLSFVPDDFVNILKGAGFTVHAEYADYFHPDIAQTCKRHKVKTADDIRLLEQEDLPAMRRLGEMDSGLSRGFDAEPPEWYRDWLKENDILVIAKADRLLGYCCVGRYADIVWIRRLAVDAAYQGCGYGKRLLEQALLYGLEKGAARGFLHVDRSNIKAVSLYEKYGFAAGTDPGERIMIRKDRQLP